ncbi:MAG: sodium:proton antiporter NhaD [Saprospiraceae bacterium]
MNLLIALVFVLGYAAIAFEHAIKINKTASALLTGVLCWTIYILGSENPHLVAEQLPEHLGEIAGILFFLLGAMTIVELIDAHDGFDVITAKISTTDVRKLLWIVSILTFFLSAVLDNLTTTIVMVSLLRKLISDKEIRLFFVGMVILAANAGGAWSPIGDVTTTMLWIGGQLNATPMITKLILPSLICLVAPLILLSFTLKGKTEKAAVPPKKTKDGTTPFEQNLVLGLGLGALVFVPIFKTITHLPPFMGMLFGLGILWVITEIIHKSKNDEDKDHYSVVHALRKADVPSVLFFLGILISIAALQSTGQLAALALYMDEKIGNTNVIVMSIGLLSSIVDNVPLVAGAMGMYSLEIFPTDHYFWTFLAYCAGTGGSILIIGSAAGVAAMGMEKIDFFWYLKKIAWLALIGYFAGAMAFILQAQVLG